jgi:hypothetical protein
VKSSAAVDPQAIASGEQRSPVDADPGARVSTRTSPTAAATAKRPAVVRARVRDSI